MRNITLTGEIEFAGRSLGRQSVNVSVSNCGKVAHGRGAFEIENDEVRLFFDPRNTGVITVKTDSGEIADLLPEWVQSSSTRNTVQFETSGRIPGVFF